MSLELIDLEDEASPAVLTIDNTAAVAEESTSIVAEVTEATSLPRMAAKDIPLDSSKSSLENRLSYHAGIRQRVDNAADQSAALISSLVASSSAMPDAAKTEAEKPAKEYGSERIEEKSSELSSSGLSSSFCSRLHVSLASGPIPSGKRSPAETTAVPSELRLPCDRSHSDGVRIWKIVDDSAQAVTFYLGRLQDRGWAWEALNALTRLKDRALADGRGPQDREEFWEDYKTVYTRLAAIPEKDIAWEGVEHLNRIHEIFSCGMDATGGEGIGRRQVEEIFTACLAQQESRLVDTIQQLLQSERENQRREVVEEVLQGVNRIRYEERAKLVNHFDKQLDQLGKRLSAVRPVSRSERENTYNFIHPSDEKGKLPTTRAGLSSYSGGSSSSPPKAPSEIPVSSRLTTLPPNRICGLRAEVMLNFRKESSNQLSVGIRDIVHVVSSEVDSNGWVRVRRQGSQDCGFVPASILGVEQREI